MGLKCWCPKCKAGQALGNVRKRLAREERLRGFEFEFDSAVMTKRLAMKDVCKDHLTFCGAGECLGKKNQRGDVFACTCDKCVEDASKKKTSAVLPVGCPGHPCLMGKTVDAWFGGVIKAGAKETQIPVCGDLTQYGHAPKSAFLWHLKFDRSCGFEVASPPCDGQRMAGLVLPVMEKVVEEEKKHGTSFVSERCGLHCTIGVEDFTQINLARLVYFVSTHQDAFLLTQAAARVDNPTCTKIHKFSKSDKRRLEVDLVGAVPDLMMEGDRNRYRVANFTRAMRDGVVEFRFGSMTTDWAKIVAYGTMVECIVQAALDGRTSTKSNIMDKFYDCVFAPYASSERVKKSWDIIRDGARAK